jgi:2-phospho-L-lactate/phosphoenolpyruvate guanylyltransferase
MEHDLPSERRQVVLIPIKDFASAKERLAERLDATQRADLARRLAEGVVAAAAPLEVAVVCDDDAVARWASAQGAFVIRAFRPGLNAAIETGLAALKAQGADWVTIVHGDLPFPQDLANLSVIDGVTIVPDRHDDGTNIMTIPTSTDFSFAYGPGSFAQHREEATRRGLAIQIVRHPELSIDIDSASDLDFVDALTRQWGPEGPH